MSARNMPALWRIYGACLIDGYDMDQVEEHLAEIQHGVRTCPHCGAQDKHPVVRGGYVCTCKKCDRHFLELRL